MSESEERFRGVDIAVIVPCYNEEQAIATVISDLRFSIPSARIIIYDNASSDATAAVALEAGAEVRLESRKGKGNVVQRAFADIDADVYVMIDGDGTYDASVADQLVATLLSGPFDHVLGVRVPETDSTDPYRSGHERGNRVLNRVVGTIFGTNVGDMMSGYRAFSRRFVKSFPAISREFEIETELTIHSLALRVPHSSVEVAFSDRADGSESKLRTYRDGWKISRLIVELTRHQRPVAFYGAISFVFALAALGFSLPVVLEFADSGVVARFPTLFLGFTLVLAALLALAAGLILDGIRQSRYERARITYLSMNAPGSMRSTRSDRMGDVPN